MKRYLPLLVSVALVLGSAAAIGVVQSSAPSGPTPAVPEGALGTVPPASTSPAPVPQGNATGLRLTPEAAANIDRVTALKGAPWLFQGAETQRIAALSPRASLVYPPGTTYKQALTQLYVSIVMRGSLPDGTTLGPPLSRGAVLRLSDDAASGLAIDLNAPWGYEPTLGFVNSPSFSLPGSLTPDEMAARVQDARDRGLPLPEGAEVDAPALLPCQLAPSKSSPATPTC